MNFLILKPVSLFAVGDVVPASCFGFDAPRLVSLGVIAPTDVAPTAGLYENDRQQTVGVPELRDVCESAQFAVDAVVKLAQKLDAALAASRKEVADLRKAADELSVQVAVMTEPAKPEPKAEEKASDDKPKGKSK